MNRSAREVIFLAILSGTLTAGKMALMSVPNVEIVTFFFIVYTLVFGWKRTMLIAIVFTTTEILIWGFGLWTIGYYLIWPLLVILTHVMRNICKTPLQWAVFSGLYGLGFGLLFALYTAPMMGVSIFAYWMSGISFDLVHMVGNFTIMLVLFNPMLRFLNNMKLRMLL